MVDNTPDGPAAIGWASSWAGRLRTPGGAGDLGAGFVLIVMATFADAEATPTRA